MKKLIAVLAIALVVAAAVWLFMRVQEARRLAAVPELLPASTLLLLEIPDFQKSRARWHGSDLHQLWREPSVQAWLQKPLTSLAPHRGSHRTVEEFLQLQPRHGFLALSSFENNEPRMVGGFYFAKSQEEAKKFIEQQTADLLAKMPKATQETITYQQHQIEVVHVSRFVLARAYENQWFFASNDIPILKAVLDRVEHRKKPEEKSLQDNENFAATIKQLPTEFAAMVFLDPRPFVEKLWPLISMTGQSLPMDQLQRLRQVRSLAAAVGFQQGKMRETDFVAMPAVGSEEKMKDRLLLAAADLSTFLYSASRIHWSDNLLTPSPPTAVGLPALIQQFTGALMARGISTEDLRLAFGSELELLGDWPADAHWPTLIATLPVNDPPRARKIIEALTSIEIAGGAWSRSDRNNNVTIYGAQSLGAVLPVQPAIAIADKIMVAASDSAAVDNVLSRLSQAAGELEKSALFRDSAALVPPAETAFNYIDTRLLYERMDAALRPLLLIGATFYPALANTIDVSKWPPTEAITKHLSPIVMSQRYSHNGYVTESVGPVTFRQATIALAATVAGLFLSLQETSKRDLLPKAVVPPAAMPVSPSPTPTPTPQ